MSADITDQNPALYPHGDEAQTRYAEVQMLFEAKHYPQRFLALENPRGVFKGTREEWLEAAAAIMGGWIDCALQQTSRISVTRGRINLKVGEITFLRHLIKAYGGKPSDYRFNPSKVRYACSLMGEGLVKSGELAHVHYAHATGNRHHEIRMSVELGGRDTKDESCRVADVLLHEMIHTCAIGHGHRGAFKQIAQTMGLQGKMTATVASDALRLRIYDEVVSRLGRYPHRTVQLTPRGQRGKGSRLIKCTCLECGFNMRTTAKWLMAAWTANEGLDCPIGHGKTMIHPDWAPPEELLE